MISDQLGNNMKLDVNVLKYLTKDDFRVLIAVEIGMRNHEIVPYEIVEQIASLKDGSTYKILKNLLENKFLHHDSSKCDGFQLTYLGYDFLAIKTLVNRGVFTTIGRQICVAAESEIYEVTQEDGTILAMKLHNVGRTSYLRHCNSFNWLYLSRLAAVKEFAFMKALGEHGFAVPKVIHYNRHCVIMSLVQDYPLYDLDIECIFKFFRKRNVGVLDKEVEASGLTEKDDLDEDKDNSDNENESENEDGEDVHEDEKNKENKLDFAELTPMFKMIYIVAAVVILMLLLFQIIISLLS